MKKLVSILILAVVAAFTFSSCEISDDNNLNYHFELIPIDSVTLPEAFVMGQTHAIKVYYRRPTSCHFYEGFYYEKDLNVRTVAVQASVIESNDCAELNEEPIEASFDFVPTSNGTYVFKFYKGQDVNGTNLFLEYEVPVVQE
jgi:hypothetical protein